MPVTSATQRGLTQALGGYGNFSALLQEPLDMTISVAIVLALAIAGVVTRIAIFQTPHADRELEELLDGHLPIQGDLLFWKLWRARSLVDPRHRWKIAGYFWLTIATVVGLLAVVVFNPGIWRW